MDLLEKAESLRKDVDQTVLALRTKAQEYFIEATQLWTEANALEGSNKVLEKDDPIWTIINPDAFKSETPEAAQTPTAFPGLEKAMELEEGEIGVVTGDPPESPAPQEPVVNATEEGGEVTIPAAPEVEQTPNPQMRNAIIGLLQNGPQNEATILGYFQKGGVPSGNVLGELAAMKASDILSSIVMESGRVFDLTEEMRARLASLG